MAATQLEVPQTSFLERMTGALAQAFGSRAIFGVPVEREGITVIPVATSVWGLGGGGGQGTAGSGNGGGGGGAALPAGYIMVSHGKVAYRPIVSPQMIIGALTVLGLAAMGTLRVLARFAAPRPFALRTRRWRLLR